MNFFKRRGQKHYSRDDLRWKWTHKFLKAFVLFQRRKVGLNSRIPGIIQRRVSTLRFFVVFVAAAIIIRLFFIQILEHKFYKTLASGQQDIFKQLFPTRGNILVRSKDGDLFPVATTRELTLVWADPRKIENSTRAAKILADALGIDELETKAKIEDSEAAFKIIAHNVSDDKAAEIKKFELAGIGFRPEENRVYPEADFGGHVLGFLGADQNGNLGGRYGIEGYYEDELAGRRGFLDAKRDPSGSLIPLAKNSQTPAENGSDLVLTVDRTIQFFVCDRLKAAVAKHGSTGGSVVVMNPKTGAILAMCGAPDFNSNNYRTVGDISVFNNPALFDAYESGSIFKAITLAGAIDVNAVNPQTTYIDTGEEKIGQFTIKNSDLKAHGVQTMTEVLEESLNTGAIFAMRQMGAKTFRDYVQYFGFGKETEIDLDSEAAGNIKSLEERGDIYSATASFGQGITVTPIQITAAFGALANGGKLMKPYIVGEVHNADGSVQKKTPQMRRQVISTRSATVLGAMLVSVVENGHGKRAGVPGYYIAGKTGTAQIPKKEGGGYEFGATIGTFAGFGPAEDPKFVMVVRINRPQDVQFAESTAAPLFGEIAKFLLQYYQIPTTRPIK